MTRHSDFRKQWLLHMNYSSGPCWENSSITLARISFKNTEQFNIETVGYIIQLTVIKQEMALLSVPYFLQEIK